MEIEREGGGEGSRGVRFYVSRGAAKGCYRSVCGVNPLRFCSFLIEVGVFVPSSEVTRTVAVVERLSIFE